MTFNSPKISVIVTVYNSQRYILRCLDSLRNQIFKEFEVIIIDDGSKDKTGKICDEYSAKDSRFKVIHKENGGVSSARQSGIELARGIYSIHVDSDDWVEPDYLEFLYNKIIEQDADICCCPIITEYGTKSLKSDTEDYYKDYGFDPVTRLFKTFDSGLCNKLIKHELYHKWDIHFNQDLFFGEDSLVLIKFLLHNPKITVVDKCLYHYDKHSNKNSITMNYNLDTFKNDMLYISILKSMDSQDILRPHINNKIASVAHSAFFYKILNQKEYMQQFGKDFKTILYSKIDIHKKINVILSLLGLKWLVHPFYAAFKKIILNH